MANFTINSLNSANTNATDTFLKSDASGVLTKISGQDLANDLATLAGIKPVTKTMNATIASQTVPMTFYKIGRVLVINMLGLTQITNAATNAWTECGTAPDGIGSFSNCGIVLPEGKLIMLRNSNAKIQYQTTTAAFWAQGTGATLASA